MFLSAANVIREFKKEQLQKPSHIPTLQKLGSCAVVARPIWKPAKWTAVRAPRQECQFDTIENERLS